MADIDWCRHEISRVEDMRLGFDLRHRDFVHFGTELSIVWSDQAARDFYTRYLEVLNWELGQLRDRLRDQVSELGAASQQIAECLAAKRKVYAFSDLVAAGIVAAEGELASAHIHIDAALNAASAAQSQMDEANSVLSRL